MIDKIPNFILKPISVLANTFPWFGRKLNSFAINSTINVSRHRPHPWSTAHDYVSWVSLTDQKWSARHLPAKDISGQPDPASLLGLFKRSEGKQRFCKKSTCLFPAFAQYLTDGFIRTRMDARLQNTSNHQIDLCALYGRTQEQTEVLRLKDNTQGKKGLLKSQMIELEEYPPFLFEDDGSKKPEFAVLDEPLGLANHQELELISKIFAVGGDRVNSVPQVAMMNTLFLREHNRLAKLIQNDHPTWDDEHVFQTARNSVIVIFIKVVVEEYINHISPAPIRFLADPSVAWNASWNKPNWLTAEFSLLYRWHSLIPDTIEWSGIKYPVHKTFMDNRFLIGAGLARSFVDLSSQQAGSLGPFNTTESLLPVEAAAIAQGRQTRLASYCDYREYVSLQRPETFNEISKNPKVVEFLKKAYHSVDDVDFYAGLFSEDTIENSPLSPLILRMVAVDAFSQAFTNPLLSEHVFRPETFSDAGWNAIHKTNSLYDILLRNSNLTSGRVSLTLESWLNL